MSLSNDRAVNRTTRGLACDPCHMVSWSSGLFACCPAHGYVCTLCEEKYRDKLRFPKDVLTEVNGFNFVKNPSVQITPLATYPKP